MTESDRPGVGKAGWSLDELISRDAARREAEERANRRRERHRRWSGTVAAAWISGGVAILATCWVAAGLFL